MSARSLIWREFPHGCSADSAAGQSLPFLVVVMARSSRDGVSGVLPNHILADTNATANHINLGWRPKWIAEIMSECTALNDAARTSAIEPNRSAIVLTDNGGDTWANALFYIGVASSSQMCQRIRLWLYLRLVISPHAIPAGGYILSLSCAPVSRLAWYWPKLLQVS